MADQLLPELRAIKRLSFGGVAALSPSNHPVDIVVRDDEYAPLYRAALVSARDQGLPVAVVSPEYLAALKMAAARDKDELDLKTLLKLGVPNRRKTRAIVSQYLGEYAARAFNAICDEVDWQASRED